MNDLIDDIIAGGGMVFKKARKEEPLPAWHPPEHRTRKDPTTRQPNQTNLFPKQVSGIRPHQEEKQAKVFQSRTEQEHPEASFHAAN